MIQSCEDQIASVSMCSVSNMHKGLFYEDVDTLEMYVHLLGHQNPRDSSLESSYILKQIVRSKYKVCDGLYGQLHYFPTGAVIP